MAGGSVTLSNLIGDAIDPAQGARPNLRSTVPAAMRLLDCGAGRAAQGHRPVRRTAPPANQTTKLELEPAAARPDSAEQDPLQGGNASSPISSCGTSRRATALAADSLPLVARRRPASAPRATCARTAYRSASTTARTRRRCKGVTAHDQGRRAPWTRPAPGRCGSTGRRRSAARSESTPPSSRPRKPAAHDRRRARPAARRASRSRSW